MYLESLLPKIYPTRYWNYVLCLFLLFGQIYAGFINLLIVVTKHFFQFSSGQASSASASFIIHRYYLININVIFINR